MSETAIFETGAKQFSAGVGDLLHVPRMSGGAGDKVSFDRVMVVRKGTETITGRPYIEGATIAGEIVDQGRDKKVVVFRFKRRTTYRNKNGHRQPHTVVRITGIQA